MGSIQNRRGSVRQAPPGVYLPFLSSDNEYDAGQECEKIATDFWLLFLIVVNVYAVVLLWRGIRYLF